MAEEHKKKIKRYEDMLRINPNDSIAKKELDKINTEFALKVFKLFFFYSFILIFILIAGSLISYLLLFKLIIK